MKSTVLTLATVLAAAGAAPAFAQALPHVATVQTNQSLVGATVGNGVVRGQSVVDVKSNGQPALGVGALSGTQGHFGSTGTVSVANNERLLGVDGPGGINSANSLSVDNPKKAPVLSGLRR